MKYFVIGLFCVSLASCTDGFTTFPVTPEQQQTELKDVNIIALNETNIASFTRPAYVQLRSKLPLSSDWQYTIGSGDVLNIIVYEHPELNPQADTSANASQSGFTVQTDGSFFFPYIGRVQAGGRILKDIRDEVAARLAEYFPDPQVEVRISQFNSQSVNIVGAVKQPNRLPLKAVPLTLLEAVNAAGGTTETADISMTTILRNGIVNHVNLKAFLERGYSENNPVLRNGDIISVPTFKIQEAYLLGEVVRPATVDLSQDVVTLTQALTRQGGVNGIRADARGVFVFRQTAGKMSVFQLATDSPAGLLLGTRFALAPGDVVYVTRSPLQRWNDTISRLLPTVQATAAARNIGG